jgi:hypothetical protein
MKKAVSPHDNIPQLKGRYKTDQDFYGYKLFVPS